MTYGTPLEPVAFGPAFEREDDAANLSRAAALLLLRNQLRGDDVAFKARAMEFRRPAESIPEEDSSRLAVPRLSGKGLRVPGQSLRRRVVRRLGAGEELREGPSAKEAAANLARRLGEEPTSEVAAELAETALVHPDELTRIAAAGMRLEVTTDPEPSLEILSRGVQSNDDLVRDVAATLLARVDPANPLLAPLTRKSKRGRAGPPTRSALLVHGTWARQQEWWQPGGDFHN